MFLAAVNGSVCFQLPVITRHNSGTEKKKKQQKEKLNSFKAELSSSRRLGTLFYVNVLCDSLKGYFTVRD